MESCFPIFVGTLGWWLAPWLKLCTTDNNFPVGTSLKLYHMNLCPEEAFSVFRSSTRRVSELSWCEIVHNVWSYNTTTTETWVLHCVCSLCKNCSIHSHLMQMGSGDFLGSTIVTNNYIRLTPDHQSRRGAIWNSQVSFCLHCLTE